MDWRTCITWAISSAWPERYSSGKHEKPSIQGGTPQTDSAHSLVFGRDHQFL